MNKKELELLIAKAKSILKKKQPKLNAADLDDAIQHALLRYLEKYGTVDTLTVAWLVNTAGNRLIDVFRHDSKHVPLSSDKLVDGAEILVDLACDNPDLSEYTSELLYQKDEP